MSLWFTASMLIVGKSAVMSDALVELFEFAPRVLAETSHSRESQSPTRRHEFEECGRETVESDISGIVYKELRSAVVRARRALSGPDEATKLMRGEFSELAKRLGETHSK